MKPLFLVDWNGWNKHVSRSGSTSGTAILWSFTAQCMFTRCAQENLTHHQLLLLLFHIVCWLCIGYARGGLTNLWWYANNSSVRHPSLHGMHTFTESHCKFTLLLLFPTTSSISSVPIVDVSNVVDKIRTVIRTGLHVYACTWHCIYWVTRGIQPKECVMHMTFHAQHETR